jgi:two-component system, sensor histidine kinase and response regulator
MPHLLIVDDVLENIQLLGRLLRKRIEGTIAVARDGEAALRAVAHRRPDLILLDVMMPRVSGYDVCRQLKSDPATADIPIIFLTAKVEEADVVKGFDLGAVDYVSKPVQQEVLLARVRTQLKIIEKEQRILEQSRQQARLLHILCHDMANPIAAVRGCLHLLRTECRGEHEIELLDLASMAIEGAGGIVDQVRETLALTDGKRRLRLEALPLDELVAESVAVLEDRFRQKGVSLLVEVGEGQLIRAEKVSFINSVLNNLLTNALKFSDPGARVRVRSVSGDETIEVWVEDEGIGMSPELVASLFDFSAVTSRVGTQGEEGTGYGMPLVKAFIEAYGGAIEVESAPRQEGQSGFTRMHLILRRANDSVPGA